MSSIDTIKTKMIVLVCKKYVSLDHNGKIIFKSNLKYAICNDGISEDDALSIVLELMYGIKEYNLNFENIHDELDDLVLKVKNYNLRNESSLKKSVLFFKDYSYEKEVLSQYLSNLTPGIITNNIKKNKSQGLNSNNIKHYFNSFSREELCYILDINQDLNFDKEKKLKKQIVDEFSKYDFDENKLKDANCKDIKKYLNSLIEESKDNELGNSPLEIGDNVDESAESIEIESNEIQDKQFFQQYSNSDEGINKSVDGKRANIGNKKSINVIKLKTDYSNVEDQRRNDINTPISKDKGITTKSKTSKIEIDDLHEKIKLFNYKKLQSMILIKEEYSEIYNVISSDDFNQSAVTNDVKRFKYYFEHFDLIENCVDLINEIKQKVEVLDEFHTSLNGKYLLKSKRIKLIIEFKELYLLVHPIKKYPYCVRDKIIDEFENLEFFIENYEDLLDYYGFKTKDYLKKIRYIVLSQEKIRLFNNKKLDDMISLKKDYYEIYQEISSIDSVEFNNIINVKEFKYFYEHFDVIKNFMELINEIKENVSLFDTFFNKLGEDEYLSNSKRKKLIDEFKKVYDLVCLINEYPPFLKSKISNEFKEWDCFIQYYDDLLDYNDSKDNNVIREINDRYIENKIHKDKEFFNDITDFNKINAIVCDEDNIKVVAGAGTGKTFTIQKKIKYLIEKRGVEPDKILGLCYTHKSASKLDERVNASLDDSKVEVCTFHEFARRVDRDCGGIKSTNRYLLDDIIRSHIKEIIRNPNKSNQLLEYFTYYINPQFGDNEFNSFYEFDKGKNLVTLKNRYASYGVELETINGECVRSLGELHIANYLFMHEINYEYEQRYERNYFSDFIKEKFLYSGKYMSLPEFSRISKEKIVNNFISWEKDRAKYKPDFYLPDDDIYLEHFGVDENGEASWLKGSEKVKYEQQMNSKRVWHEMYGTNLIETYSYYVSQDILIEKLEELLKQNDVTIGQRDKKEILDMLLVNNKVGEYKRFADLVKNFINNFEANNLHKSDMKKFKQKNKHEKNLFTRKRQAIFLNIVSEIYDKYYEYNQGDDIDHNREISNALNLIKNKKYTRKFDYILIDEYQDINYVRCKLIQELQKNTGAKVFVVGDDWQSIYGFGGSNVNLFLNFDKYFPHSKTFKLRENRRNSQKINDIARKFIMKNESGQIDKVLIYHGDNINSDPIKLVSYGKYDYTKPLRLDAILQDILKNNHKKDLRILILGRMNEDIDGYVNNRLFKEKTTKRYRKIIYSKNNELDITFMNVHQSKGLEYDEVIVLNLRNDITGFPSQIKDDPILKFVKNYDDDFPFAEERRLFYVALTRTRNNVYLLYPEKKYSIFIRELKSRFKLKEQNLTYDYGVQNQLYNENAFFKKIERKKTEFTCPQCKKGKITIIIDNYSYKKKKKSVFVSCSEQCGYVAGPYHASIEDMKYIEKCPSCKGILVRQGNVLKCSMNYHGGCTERKELKLDEDDLKYKDYEILNHEEND